MTEQVILITGANRGIGLATAEQFLKRGDTVVCGTRKKGTPALKRLAETHPGRVLEVDLEVTSDASVDAALDQLAVKPGRLDVVINMAGIMTRPHDQPLEKLDFDQCRESFEVNSLGPLRIARACLPLLRKSSNPRVVNVTSGCGSLSGKDNGEFYAYAASKAALNMISRTFAFEFKKEGICCVALDPGWVKTDLGGPDADLEPAQSASGICQTVSELSLADSSEFLLYDGSRGAW